MLDLHVHILRMFSKFVLAAIYAWMDFFGAAVADALEKLPSTLWIVLRCAKCTPHSESEGLCGTSRVVVSSSTSLLHEGTFHVSTCMLGYKCRGNEVQVRSGA